MSENTNNLKYEDSKFSIENAILDKVEGAVDSSTGEKTITLNSNLKVLGSLDISGATYPNEENPEWLSVTTDAEGKILEGITAEGKKKVMVETVFEGGIEGVASQEDVDELDSRVDALETNDLALTIPDIIYAVVDTELNLWNDTVSLSVDRGLSSPINYQVRWQCSKGLITDRCFRYTPIAADAGNNYSCSCYLYDMKNNLITSKTFTIKVLAKDALNTTKNIVYFGDSLGGYTANKLGEKFNSAEYFEGVKPNMCGTIGTPYKCEAIGGYGWYDYATAGRKAFRCEVANVNGIALYSQYTNNGYTWTIIEVNINEGTGNILITKFDNMYSTDAPETNGTLVPTGSGDSISYTNAHTEGANPLWNANTEKLDIEHYKQTLVSLGELTSVDEKIDAVSFQFGINDSGLADNTPRLMGYIDALYKAFISDNPYCKFIIGLTTSPGNDLNGSGANYGATRDWMTYLNNIYRIRQFYLSLQNNENYPNLIIAPASLEIDRYYGYAFSTRQISQRTITTEYYHNNYVHPGNDGYGQIGDAYFATYIGALMN